MSVDVSFVFGAKQYGGKFEFAYNLTESFNSHRFFGVNANYNECGNNCIDLSVGGRQSFVDLKCEKPQLNFKIDRKDGYPEQEDNLYI
jgi:hypothetical protein